PPRDAGTHPWRSRQAREDLGLPHLLRPSTALHPIRRYAHPFPGRGKSRSTTGNRGHALRLPVSSRVCGELPTVRLPVVVTGLLAMLAIAVAQPSAAAAGACKGSIFNPITDTNWNNMFPITVGGISAGGGSNPPLMHMPALCMCPGAYGIPVP